MDEVKYKQSIAIFPDIGMGDALVSLVMAQNFVNNHYQVTIYHSLIPKLAPWFPQVVFQTYKDPETFKVIADKHDFIIGITSSSLPLPLHEFITENPHKFIIIGNDAVHENYLSLHSNVTNNSHPLWQSLIDAAGTSMMHIDTRNDMVTNITIFCRDYLNLANVVIHVDFTPPAKVEKNYHNKHIIIHPDSSNWRRNWSPAKFIKLSKYLVKDGYEVTFALSPAEYSDWKKITPNFIQLTQWSIPELAKQLYQARLFIGNNSGPGHLASLLGITTITIFPRLINPVHYVWRPGWAKNKVITPRRRFLKFRIKNHIYSNLSVKTMYHEIKKIL